MHASASQVRSCVLLSLHHHVEGAGDLRVELDAGLVGAQAGHVGQLHVLSVQLAPRLLEDGVHNLSRRHTAQAKNTQLLSCNQAGCPTCPSCALTVMPSKA